MVFRTLVFQIPDANWFLTIVQHTQKQMAAILQHPSGQNDAVFNIDFIRFMKPYKVYYQSQIYLKMDEFRLSVIPY